MTVGVHHEICLESVQTKLPMKETRGDGLVYQATYIDKRTGERKTASTCSSITIGPMAGAA
jgi:hypothetical protein